MKTYYLRVEMPDHLAPDQVMFLTGMTWADITAEWEALREQNNKLARAVDDLMSMTKEDGE